MFEVLRASLEGYAVRLGLNVSSWSSAGRILGAVALGSLVIGCSGKSSQLLAAMPNPQGPLVQPFVRQTGNPPDWEYFPINSPFSNTPTGITVGPDKKLWFVESHGHRLVRIDMLGNRTNHVLPSATQAQSLTVGADGKFYMTDAGTNSILVVTTGGTVTKYPVTQDSQLEGVTKGTDGNVWFAAESSVDRITPTGQITSFPVMGNPPLFPVVTGITTGPDGNIWFTEQQVNKIGRLTIATSAITEFPAGCNAVAITTGPDGDLWYTCGNQIGRMTTTGTFTLFTPMKHPWASPDGITAGPDGQLWYTSTQDDAVVSVSTTGTFAYHLPPGGIAPDPYSIAAGPDGNLWFTNLLQGIGVLVLDQLSVTPNSWAGNAGQMQVITVSELNYSRKWTAKSLNTSVATVKNGSSSNQFVITAVATGTTSINVSDSIGNRFDVSVTVN